MIRVRYASINPVDHKTRRGEGVAELLEGDFPYILGFDVAGTVEGVGLGVTSFKKGDSVFGMIGFPQAGGAYAEYAVAPEKELTKIPEGVDLAQAAAAPPVALTAYQAIFEHGKAKPSEKVVVVGASGGVGHVALQLLKAKKNEVIAISSKRNDRFVRSLGAAQVFHYDNPGFSEFKFDADLVADFVGGESLKKAFELVRSGGRVISIVTDLEAGEVPRKDVDYRWILVRSNLSHLQEIGRLMKEGQLKVQIQEKIPVDQIQMGHKKSESARTAGKIVVQF